MKLFPAMKGRLTRKGRKVTHESFAVNPRFYAYIVYHNYDFFQ